MSPRSRSDDDEAARARSAAEREAARLERERRRAEREGRLEPEPVAEPVPEAVAEPGPEPEPVAEPVREPESVTVPPGDDDQPTGSYEAPAGIRRAGAPSVRDLPEVGGARPPVPGAPRGLPRPPRRRRRARRIVAFLGLLLVVAAGVFAFLLLQPGKGEGDAASPVRVTIPRGATAGDVGDLLAARGVIDSSFFFGLRARLSGKRDDLKAGTFTLRKDMSYAAALDALTTQNPEGAPTVKVTIPEGRSIGEAAPAVRQSVEGSYVKAAARNPRTVTGLRGYGVPPGTKTLEGFLFPATYELKKGATARDLVDEQLATFRKTYDKLDTRAARRRNLSDYEVLTIASMIEREAMVAKDRRLISAVIANRLDQRMPLGIDATLRYRLDNWTRPLRVSELETDSAFNTRKHQGLPPTPIGSPGLASIKAALDPAKVPYLFYVVKPCGEGAHAFSSTDAEFQKDVAAYNRKRDQLGGKDPSNC